MLKQLLWVVILSILAVLFMSEIQHVLGFLAEGNRFLLKTLGALVPGSGQVSKIIAQSIPLILVPLLIGAVIAAVLFPINNRVPHFIAPLIWVIWVLTTVTVILVS